MPERDDEAVTLSPDVRRAVLQIREGTIGLWIYDFSRQTMTPLATTGGSSQGAVWTADGKRIIYRGTRTGSRNFYWKSADGSGARRSEVGTRDSSTGHCRVIGSPARGTGRRGLTLVTAPGAGHFVRQAAPDLVTSTLRWWL